MSQGDLRFGAAWVKASEVVGLTEQQVARALQGRRQSGLWEFREGEVWVNLRALGSVEDLLNREAQARPIKGPTRQKPCRTRKDFKSPDLGLRYALSEATVVRWFGKEQGGREDGEQYVYFVECEGYVKIGVARWPEKRLTVMQGGNPFPMTLWGLLLPKGSAFELEAHLHHWLRPYSLKLEWFNADAMDLLWSIEVSDLVKNGRASRI